MRHQTLPLLLNLLLLINDQLEYFFIHTVNMMTLWSVKMHVFLCIRIAVDFLKQ